MPCFHPVPAWRTPAGAIVFSTPFDRQSGTDTSDDAEYLRLPCGRCIGCTKSRAREWAIRCTLELRDHDAACWATLTYDGQHVPPTLQPHHLSRFLKRLRARVHPAPVRFFGSGEYGETNGRPHYHVILFGLEPSETQISPAWAMGHVRVDPLSPAAISYVAGYTSKKIGEAGTSDKMERVDPNTGEVYVHQEPFVLMSRRPGIGATARQYWQSWKQHAVHNGNLVPVPRYLHEAWKRNTTPAQHEELAKLKKSQINPLNSTPERLAAGEAIALSKHHISRDGRKL